ncbi:hypothetical protein RIF29_25096 [Crotalaria pallida]|uniref:Uncharacterized protein n=1 Tax=Crotalaria pallida TaxID=3830 RepID=A0AAN9ET58_CROPI
MLLRVWLIYSSTYSPTLSFPSLTLFTFSFLFLVASLLLLSLSFFHSTLISSSSSFSISHNTTQSPASSIIIFPSLLKKKKKKKFPFQKKTNPLLSPRLLGTVVFFNLKLCSNVWNIQYLKLF